MDSVARKTAEFDADFECVDEEALFEALEKYEQHHQTTKSPQSPEFDLTAGACWIYPTNYEVRKYQFNIVSRALFENCLVALPTGLGKTFIAAVVMYNFYRWFPQGKVVFLAPTKPLVAQQIEACFKIMGISQADTASMTGATPPCERSTLWKFRRVFFLTPQTLHNDLGSLIAPA
eukprot:Sdes_comp8367_c0_seq1m39